MAKLVLPTDFLVQAMDFIARDIEREIQLARTPDEELRRLGVNTGGGNFLAALGLLCYTEFGGKLKFGRKAASRNFNEFFDFIGPDYTAFRQQHDVYDIFRCGLAHQYYVKKSCRIAMLEGRRRRRIGIFQDASGKYTFVVESYFRDLRAAFERLRTTP